MQAPTRLIPCLTCAEAVRLAEWRMQAGAGVPRAPPTLVRHHLGAGVRPAGHLEHIRRLPATRTRAAKAPTSKRTAATLPEPTLTRRVHLSKRGCTCSRGTRRATEAHRLDTRRRRQATLLLSMATRRHLATLRLSMATLHRVTRLRMDTRRMGIRRTATRLPVGILRREDTRRLDTLIRAAILRQDTLRMVMGTTLTEVADQGAGVGLGPLRSASAREEALLAEAATTTMTPTPTCG